MRKDDDSAIKESENFLKLLNNEYTDTIASNALNTLKRRKDNKLVELPLASDLKLLRAHLLKTIPEARSALETDTSYVNFRILALKVLVRLTVFNKRRTSEVAGFSPQPGKPGPTGEAGRR